MVKKGSEGIPPQFYFIELITWFEGKIKVVDVMQQFGISRQAASPRLGAYEKFYAELRDGRSPFLKENKTNKREAAEDFEPIYINKHVDQYLTWLSSGGLDINNIHKEANEANQLPLPTRNISPQIIRPLVQAIKENMSLEVDYLSLSHPVNDGRIIAPHSFVKTNLRWHVRAWDEGNQRFADFNLSRFRGVPDFEGKATKTKHEDSAWNTFVTLILKPDSRLAPEKQAILEQDYEMRNGQLHIKTRACLATYVLQELRVSAKFVDVLPEAQQLVLVNRGEVKKWLFDF